ncbi:hypothetical protein ACHAW6_000528 [Cyclotella cf. meneghiniana]
MCIKLPSGIKTKHGNSKDYVLKLLANLYDQKQVGQVWNQYIVGKLQNIDSNNPKSMHASSTMMMSFSFSI